MWTDTPGAVPTTTALRAGGQVQGGPRNRFSQRREQTPMPGSAGGVGAGPPGPTGRGLWPRLVLNRRCLWTVHLPPCLRTWRPRSAPIQRDADRCPMHPVWAPGLSPLGRSHEPRVVLGWPVDQQQMSLMPSPATEPTWPECPVVLECQALWSQPPLLPKGPPGTQNPALWDECPAMC